MRPVASNLNLMMGQTQANLVTVKVGNGGSVSMYTEKGAHMIVDVLGYYAPATGTAGRFTPLTPSRLIDARDTTKVAAGGTVDVPVLGQGGVPATGVSSVVVTVVATNATAPGFVTVHASGTPLPATSTSNPTRVNGKASNLAIVPVGMDGAICVFSKNGAHVIGGRRRLVRRRVGEGSLLGPVRAGQPESRPRHPQRCRWACGSRARRWQHRCDVSRASVASLPSVRRRPSSM